MKALLLTEIGKPQEIIDDLDVDLPQEHEVLVRTCACGLCHSDLHFRQGKWTTFPLPMVLGHECSGVVEKVGSQVSYLKPGDHVVGCLTPFCGECENCMKGRPNICTGSGLQRGSDSRPRLMRRGKPVSQFVNLSGFSEMMLVHERALVKIDRDFPMDVAAIMGCAVTTGMGAVFNTAQVRPGETVAVFGCGGVGLSVIQAARITGAGRIIAVDRSPAKAEAALAYGATDAVVADGMEVATILEMTKGGVDHGFEAVGLPATARAAFDVTKAGGAATIVGLLPEGSLISVDSQMMTFDRKIQGSSMGSNRFRIDIPRYMDMYEKGVLKVDEMITGRIALPEVDEALVALDTGDGITRTVAMFS
ncbi:Zn-dependent alcohol dehydrogenase [Maritimibacter alkaliphilus]|uniref:Zn-dependent alcohol dehydrogenase n=1 Tax=Maritimibacter alkaliphilus TaxID=404236 RepID=UPI001C9615A7|nr:Zn-dependent alcohol dehydrogenase [Maritimibacter alkaliphilus]MBY6089859.1 Zn-dependent alcohol dehydrogenase [Maritimibacter alkaliphilus]